MTSHCIRRQLNKEKKEDGFGSSVHVRASLLAATTKEEAYAAIWASFAERLQSLLQSENAVPLHLAADKLGVDSLVAVDIRSWFLRELQVDIPVLKILGGATVGNMILLALESMSPANTER